MKVYFDTNVLVAALKAEHPHHAGSLAALHRVRHGDLAGNIAAQSLAELYSVLTRTPFTVPIYPDEAQALIQQSIVPFFNIIDVTAESYLAAIAGCASAGWKGGRVHDAVHIQAAKQAKCDLIYTYDVAHFQSLAPEWSGRIQSPPPA
jgi:predicted nucleic acid-binding protein